MKGRRIKLLAVSFAVLVLAAGTLMMFLKGDKSSEAREKTVFAMDTACTARVWGADPEAVTDEINRLDRIFDCHSGESEISRLNSDGGGRLSAEAGELIKASLELTGQYPQADISIGAVTKLWNVTGKDPKVPSDSEIQRALKSCGCENIKLDGDSCTLENNAQIDVGAAAKGYALDRARQVLIDSKAGAAVVSMGSSSLVFGKKPDAKPFTVAVKDPSDKHRLLLKFMADECFVSTSGGYERFFEADGKKYIHIFDKTTGRPAETDLVSATVICDNGLKSDQLSTAVFIGGTKKLGEFFADKSIKLIAVDTDGNIHISKELEDKITLEDKQHKMIVEK